MTFAVTQVKGPSGARAGFVISVPVETRSGQNENPQERLMIDRIPPPTCFPDIVGLRKSVLV